MNQVGVRTRPISIAVLAIGGEGGGVLADWIAGLAEAGGFLAQTTSVPGVAQRTGATIYYLELFPAAEAKAAGCAPVLALMPVPGDVDIVVASELMEAARAVERGLVTPDRTTLIASTHRVYAMSEKTALADGRADDARLLQACRAAAKRAIAFDMEAIAEASGSVISAVLFGALAGSGALPFPRGAFEAAIRRGNVGVAKSLAAFTAGFEAARDDGKRPAPGAATRPTAIPARLQSLVQSLSNDLPASARVVVEAGVARLAEYQDLEYARQFIERLRPIHAFEAARGRHGPLFEEAARQLALAMSYEDTIRVAALKIARQRFARVREEVKLGDGQILEIAEFLHPRTEEIADTLPAVIGRWLLRTRWARRLVDRFTRSGRTVKTTSLWGFLLLYSVAALRPLRRRSLRFVEEQRAIDAWLDTTMRTARTDYDLAVEVAKARNLVKGYGDTHAGGRAKFELLIGCLPRLTGRSDAAAAFARLHKAALADEHGGALKKAVLEL